MLRKIKFFASDLRALFWCLRYDWHEYGEAPTLRRIKRVWWNIHDGWFTAALSYQAYDDTEDYPDFDAEPEDPYWIEG